MDPTITAAWISGGVGALGIVSTAVTAWIGSRNTRRATEQAITAGADNTRATLAAAREDRLWEKRAASYEETLMELLYRQAKRDQAQIEYRRLDEDEDEQVKDFLAGGEQRTWFEIQARLVAYGSDDVLEALRATRGMQNVIALAYAKWAAISRHRTRAMFSEGSRVPDVREVEDARRQLDEAIRDAQAADDALIEVIRDKLRSRPEAAIPPTVLPAVRHRFSLRRRH